jgi:aspartate carbamoyltransferase
MSVERTRPTEIIPEPLEKINGNFERKDIVSIEQFNPASVEKLFEKTDLIKRNLKTGVSMNLLEGQIAALLFYEASSRTFGTFASAVQRLGGGIIPITDVHFSSVSKGETFEDTIRTFAIQSNVVVLRHSEVGSAKRASEVSTVPIINAGDGIGEHPTQALLDMYTVYENTGRLDNLRGLMAGDILNGRTIHSFLKGLSMYPGNSIYLLSPQELQLDRKHLDEYRSAGLKIHEIENTDEIPENCDFWYWTRVQKERFQSIEDYERVKNKFILNSDLTGKYASDKTIFMHPLPRVGEISEEVDTDLRSVYLTSQMENGLYTRMALLGLVLGKIR